MGKHAMNLASNPPSFSPPRPRPRKIVVVISEDEAKNASGSRSSLLMSLKVLLANSRVVKKITLKMDAVRKMDVFRKKEERQTNCGEFI